jgi:hypothetical protein
MKIANCPRATGIDLQFPNFQFAMGNFQFAMLLPAHRQKLSMRPEQKRVQH